MSSSLSIGENRLELRHLQIEVVVGLFNPQVEGQEARFTSGRPRVS